MASDISPKAPPGSLWKQPKLTKHQLLGETEEEHQKRMAREHLLGYRTGPRQREWKRLRDKFLKDQKLMDEPGDWWRCDMTHGYGCGRLTDAPEVDHIIKRSVRPDLLTVTSNFQILCHDCHQRKDNGFKFKEAA